MPQCKCKMCGGLINFNEIDKTATCEFCGTEQPVAYTDNIKKQNLFNRANTLRLNNDFDKALATYENILIDDPNDAEAHWGICLCRYGIEYVDDPKTKKKIPTCHRTVFNSIFDDIDYKETIANTDVVAKRLYQEEAEKIDKIQKTILAISQKEEPYDIFICYKETDNLGSRTRDSVIAQEIYQELTDKGYKVFFSRITLESKLGSEYEPIIFAALQSSKVMLVIGTKEEYFNAPWVKNEWSRFLGFMKEQRGKYLIPCYKDIDAYNMPEEFLALQSQNIDKLGFLQDLIRGIDKIFGRDKKEARTVVNETISASKYQNLLKRVALCIEDREFDQAKEFIEEILNENAECAEAYYYRILVEKEINEDQLRIYKESLDNDRNFEKALRFANEEFKQKLVSINEDIKRIILEKNNSKIYFEASSLMNNRHYLDAESRFKRILEYRDSKEKSIQCRELYNEDIFNKANIYLRRKEYDEAISTFKTIIEYKNSKDLIKECEIKKEEEKFDKIYVSNTTKIEQLLNKEEFFVDEALINISLKSLKEIVDYKDTKEKIINYEKLLCDKKEKIKIEMNRRKEEKERLENERKARIQRELEEKEKQAKIRKDKTIRFIKIASPIVAAITTIVLLIVFLFVPLSKYNKAMDLINSGQYNEAELILKDIDGFKDADTQIKLMEAREFFEDGNYEDGIRLIYENGGQVNITYNTDGGSAEKENEVLKKSRFINNECEKVGYTFHGWVLDTFNFSEDNYIVDLSLKASYEIITYTLTFDLDGGNKENYPTSYTVETEDITIKNPTRKGYTFLGWTIGRTDEPTKDLVIEKGSVGNRTYTANWEANIYTITYDYGYGDKVTTQEVTYDTSYVLTMPEREGYTFKYWDYDGAKLYAGLANTVWNYDTDITIVAIWDLNTYDINYILNGGTNNPNNPSTYNYETETITLLNPTKTGYTFLGWTNKDYVEPTLNVTITKNSVGDKTFEANWEATTYIITYNVNGGDALLDDTQEVVYDSSYTLIEPTRPGYNFAGWYLDGKLIEDGIWQYDRDKELEARWTLITYYIYYELDNGENHKDNPTSYTYESEDITFKSPEKEGYTFLGWTSVDQTTPMTNLVLPHNSTKDRTITAHFEANTYVITYDVNDGDALLDDTQEVVYDDYFTLITPTRPGYKFICWDYEGKEFNEGIWKISKDIELVARWERITYTISYVLNEGTNHKDNVDTYHYDCEDIVIKSPEKEGYTFLGWTSSLNDEPTIEPVIKKNSIGNFTFTAHYQANTYVITYDVNGGDTLLDDDQEVVYDDYFTLITPTRPGYEFICWDYEGKEFNEGIWKVSKDIELVARWERITYTVSYVLNGGTNHTDNVKEYHYDCEDIVIKSPEKEGYTFLGWTSSLNDEPTIEPVIKKNSIGNLTFTAHYQANTYVITYDVNGGDTLLDDDQEVVYDDYFALITPTRTGYSFVGWTYEGKLVDVDKVWSISNDCTLVAEWKANTYTITIVKANSTKTYTATYDSDYYLGTDYKSYYYFDGYFMEEYGEGTRITDSKGYSLLPYTYTEDIIVYSSFMYDVTFVSNGGEELETVTYHENEYLDSSIVTTKDNRTFAGWYTSSSLISEVSYTKSLGNITLYARWQEEVLPYELTYTISNGAITISGSSYSGTDLIIPSHIGDVPVTTISGSAFTNMTSITTVDVPKTVTSIGVGAFKGCNSIVEITLPFVGQSESVTDYTSVFGYIFGYSKSNLSGWLDGSISSSSEFINEKTGTAPSGTIWQFSNVAKYDSVDHQIYSYYYYVPSTIKEVVITNDVTIPVAAFNGCTFIDTITIPETAETIGAYAFYNCSGLTKLNSETDGEFNIPKAVTNISDYMFYGCSQAVEFTMGSIETIGSYAFYNCSLVEYFNSETQYKIDVPNTVTSIGSYAFNGMVLITEVNVPDSVESIGEGAFKGCNSIVEITLPFVGAKEGVTDYTSVFGYIFGYSKSNLSGWLDGSISASSEFINEKTGTAPSETIWQFSNVYTKDSVDHKIYSYYYYVPSTIKEVVITNDVTIPVAAFNGCTFIDTITIPETAETIGAYAFYNCSGLTKLNSETDGEFNIPKAVTNISDYMFYGCSQAVEFTMGSIETIGSYAFYNCSLVEYFNSETQYKIDVPNTVTSIGSYAFNGMVLITEVNVPDSVTNISSYAFYNCSLITKITIPFIGNNRDSNSIFSTILNGCTQNSIIEVIVTDDTTIPSSSFSGWTSIVSITIPETVVTIGSAAFYNCSGLTRLNSEAAGEFNIPEAVTNISDCMFYGCSQAVEFTMGSIETIGSYAFYNCSLVEYFNSETQYKIDVPNTVTSIGNYAFNGMVLITEVNVPDSVESIGEGAFKGCNSIVEITLPFVGQSESVTDYTSVFGYIFGYSKSSLSSWITGSKPVSNEFINEKTGTAPSGTIWQFSNVAKYGSVDHQIYSYYYYVPSTIRKVVITSDVMIPAAAFNGCTFIDTITIPETAETIGAYAFYNCSGLTKLNSETDGEFNIPKAVTNISDYMFYGCSQAVEFTMGSIETIGSYAFYNCSLVEYFNSETQYKIDVPNTVTSIGNYAFNGMVLITEVNVPDSVESIGEGAFKGCNSIVEITLPFVGQSESVTDYTSVFGYIFGYSKSNLSGWLDGSISSSSEFINEKTGTAPSGTIWQFSNVAKYDSVDHQIYSYYYYVPSTIKEVVITNDVTIPVAAFNGCTFIDTITIPETAETIGAYAFYNCSGLTKLNSETDGEFNIPKAVTNISDYMFYGCSQAVEFTMGSIETIGSYAFYNCSLVEYFNSETQYKIDVPNTVTSIGSYAFNGMVLITEVNVPDSVTNISSYAFYNCSLITKITIPFIGNNRDSNSIFSTILNGCTQNSIIEVIVTDDTTIPSSSFSGWTSIVSITIPETVVTIGSAAFYNCSGLTRLNSEAAGEFNIPEAVTNISDCMFYGCSQAVEFTMGSIETIGSYAFYNCSLVEYFNSETQYKIDVPNTVTSIGNYAFNGMVLITEVNVPDSVESIGEGAFKGCNSIVEITLPFVGQSESVTDYTSVFGYIFGYSKSSLSSWITGSKPVSNEFINEKTGTAPSGTIWQFSNVAKYGSVDHQIYSYYYYVPSTIRKVVITSDVMIPAAAFNGCTFIDTITIPETAETIGAYAFYNCSGLTKLNSETDGEFNIPKAVTNISDYMFYGCSQAVEFTMGSIETIGSYAFYNCSLVEYFNSETQYKIDVPNTVTSIGNYAFNGMVLITEVNVPDSVESIGEGAFKGCNSIVEITLPFVGAKEGVTDYTSVFGYIFGYSKSNLSGWLDGSISASSEFINEKTGTAPSETIWQFSNVYTKDSVDHKIYSYYYYVPSTIKEVVITNDVTIPVAAFNGCTFIDTITIPETAETIGEYAFYNCNADVKYTYKPKISSIWDGSIASSYHSGLGTSDDPYVIFTASEFAYFGEQVNNGNSYSNTYFKLSSNIRLANKEFNTIGSLDYPFNGYFDGCGYIIKDFKINGTSNYTGIFGYVNGTIENLGIVNMTLTASSTSSGNYYAGAIAYLGKDGVINNVYSTGSVTNNASYYSYAGGLVGYSEGLIEDSYSSCNVVAKSTSLFAYAGGLVGYLKGTINNCFASGNVTANGANETYSKNGGLVGDAFKDAAISNSYRTDSQVLIKNGTSGKQNNESGEVKTLEEIIDVLKTIWDDKIWNLNKTLPRLYN